MMGTDKLEDISVTPNSTLEFDLVVSRFSVGRSMQDTESGTRARTALAFSAGELLPGNGDSKEFG